jgi:non-homologous end joining protein Ku
MYLCHEDTSVTGQTFEVGGGYVTRVRYQRAVGMILSPSENTPEFIAENKEKIFEQFEGGFSPDSADDAYKPILKQIIANQLKSKQQPKKESVRVEGFQSSGFFEEIQNALNDENTRAQIINEYKSIYQFIVSNPENSKNQTWTLDLKVI